ncbi:hypothetical protein OV203_02400 [Nannocystis sp. ILAH1]|uniref:hypothetical protein n=1 Tax=Nannocystis sp. ILAH1 TaxID=2996789 RepID=UPI002272118F|nr:hypothetical protein [Nannocystis sp. ILAH1]MCY0985962.1 hypothetical protein [Nannocystis sp. ILAH1]
MIGKPCGSTCIAEHLECHVGEPGTFRPLTTAGWVAGSILTVAGLGLMLAGLLAPARMTPRRLECSASGCSLTLRF